MRRPILIYDGRCAFCRRSIARARARTGARVVYLPLQLPFVLAWLGVRRADAKRAVQLIEPGGRRSSGAAAALGALAYAPGFRALRWLVRDPIARFVAERVYRFVARHRVAAARVDRALFMDTVGPSGHRRTRWLFLRALGVVSFAAFASLRAQVIGLFGEHGIQPVRRYLDAARAIPARRRLGLVPTVFWMDASDRALVRACRAGEIASLALAANVAPRVASVVVWAMYLSFVSVGQSFLSFQWDSLLVETSAHAVLVAPRGLRPGLGDDEVPIELALALRWLAARLHFASGIAKLRSQDVTWRRGTACAFHHETQPLPTRVSWYARHLPQWMQRVGTYGVLALECCAPPLAFFPRRLRRASFALLTGLQLLIQATGNFGFFNALSFALLLWTLDDRDLGRETPVATPRPLAVRTATSLLLAAIAIASAATTTSRLFAPVRSRRVAMLLAKLAPWHLASSYGLFSAMTVERPEIVMEASMDGVRWEAYDFKYKPGDPKRAPRFIAPHMPRLDWLMWFAAMRPPSPWVVALLARLLEARPEVLALFERAPFGGRRPRYVRATLYAYRMTDRKTRARTGAWWSREEIGTYVPPIALATQIAASAQADA